MLHTSHACTPEYMSPTIHSIFTSAAVVAVGVAVSVAMLAVIVAFVAAIAFLLLPLLLLAMQFDDVVASAVAVAFSIENCCCLFLSLLTAVNGCCFESLISFLLQNSFGDSGLYLRRSN